MWLLCATSDYRKGDETACRQKQSEFWNIPLCGICCFLRVKWRIWQLQSRRTLVFVYHSFILLLRRKAQSSSPPYMFRKHPQETGTKHQKSDQRDKFSFFGNYLFWTSKLPFRVFVSCEMFKLYLPFTLDLTNVWLNLWVCTLKASQQGSRNSTVREITLKTISYCSKMQPNATKNLMKQDFKINGTKTLI